MNEDTKLTKQIVAIDGFDGFTDERAGTGDNDAQPAPGSIIKGNLIKFTNQATWELRDGEEMPPDLELIAVDILRIVQKWIDQKPVETRILAPGEKIPDVKALNASCPKSEWHKDLNGQEQGPWQFQYVTYFLDPATMDRFTFPTATTGGSVCARDLADRVKWMRRFRPGLFAVVTLADTFMNTQYGGRQRPHYIVKRWVQMGEAAPAMSGPTPQPRIAVRCGAVAGHANGRRAAAVRADERRSAVQRPAPVIGRRVTDAAAKAGCAVSASHGAEAPRRHQEGHGGVRR